MRVESSVFLSFCYSKILTFKIEKNVIFRGFSEREEVLLKNTLIFETSENHFQM